MTPSVYCLQRGPPGATTQDHRAALWSAQYLRCGARTLQVVGFPEEGHPVGGPNTASVRQGETVN